MSLWQTSACCEIPNPGLDVRPEKPQLGVDGATTWKLGSASLPPEVSSGRIFTTSRKLPGSSQHQLVSILALEG